MYLVDTNIWLERLLGQAKSDEVGQFLDQTPPNQLLITDFAFHSIHNFGSISYNDFVDPELKP